MNMTLHQNADFQVPLHTALPVSTENSWQADRTVKSPSTGSGQSILDSCVTAEGVFDMHRLSLMLVGITDMLETTEITVPSEALLLKETCSQVGPKAVPWCISKPSSTGCQGEVFSLLGAEKMQSSRFCQSRKDWDLYCSQALVHSNVTLCPTAADLACHYLKKFQFKFLSQ